MSPVGKAMTERRRRRIWPYVLGSFAIAIVVIVAAFRWDWLIPFIEPRVSAALGRPVHIAHLHVKLGGVTQIVVDDLAIDNPADWPGGGKMGTVEHLMVNIETQPLLHGFNIVLPSITVERPDFDLQQLADKRANWTFASATKTDTTAPADPNAGPKIGTLVINDGTAHVKSVPLRADFQVAIATKSGGAEGKDQIVASLKGNYAEQAILAQFVGGALLSLRDGHDPYPIDLKLRNGPTSLSVTGSVQNPMAFAGADVRLELAGPDMSLLLPLTGIAIPKTPPYRVAGKLDYQAGVVKFHEFTGRVGSSDLAGDIDVDTKPQQRPVLTADLHSKMVDLKDLGGFIGANPGDPDKGTKKPEPARSNGKVLPDQPLSIPRLNVADVHLKYTAGRIEGQRQPLDNMKVALDIVDGDITLHPLAFGIGQGQITSQINLSEKSNELAARADVNFDKVDLSKLLDATGLAKGAGVIGGRAIIQGTGKSIGEILARGQGEVKLYMGAGGDLSALLVDISGLQFGNALLSALGIPNRAKIQCLITDVALTGGDAKSRLTMLDTDEGRIGIVGGVDLRNEKIDLTLRTEAKHFSVGSIPAAIGVGGTLGSPSINPDLGEAGVRAGAAVGLGVLLTPIAGLLPTIQFGSGEDNACAGLLREIRTPPREQPNKPVRPATRRRR